MTGQLEEEKIQVYVRLGIRLLYKVHFFPFVYRSLVYSSPRVLRVEWRTHEIRDVVSVWLCEYELILD